MESWEESWQKKTFRSLSPERCAVIKCGLLHALPSSLPPFLLSFHPSPGDENARGPACLRGLVLGPPLDVQGEQGALRDGGERLDEGFEGPAPVLPSDTPSLCFSFLCFNPTFPTLSVSAADGKLLRFQSHCSFLTSARPVSLPPSLPPVHPPFSETLPCARSTSSSSGRASCEYMLI